MRDEDSVDALGDIHLSTFDDTTPLHWAAYLGLPDLCAWLISKGMPVHQMSPIGTPLNCALLGHHAIVMSDDDAIEDVVIDP